MTDKTLGAYKRTTPDPDETTGEALARLQAEMTRLLDEADAEMRDAADGGVAAALIEEEEGVDAAASRLAAFARKFGIPPEWTTAPAVQAWHRSDHRTEHDGTPGQPRIWSPDYGTTERWSTPSLRDVHWSDLVDVVPLAPVRECPDPEQHSDGLPDAVDALTEALKNVHKRAEKAEKERDEALRTLKEVLDSHDETLREIAEGKYAAESRPLSPDAMTAREHLDAAWEAAHVPEDGIIPAGADYLWRSAATGRVVQALPDEEDASAGAGGSIERRLLDPLPPARPEGAEKVDGLVEDWMNTLDGDPDLGGADDRRSLADFLARRGVRVVTEDGAA